MKVVLDHEMEYEVNINLSFHTEILTAMEKQHGSIG